jgi:CDGSH-type Zn-finger protein
MDQRVPHAGIRLAGFGREKEGSLAETKITVKKDGSLRVEGEIILCDPEGVVFDLGGRTSISLCRCGHSEDKPFCDGSHKRIGFQSEVKARALPPPAPKPPLA